MNHTHCLGSTCYSAQSQPYRLQDYQPGCGLRRKYSPSHSVYSDWPDQCGWVGPSCKCRGREVNFHERCPFSLRTQPKCGCCSRMLPSLYHKLLSAPYTKICKQKTPIKQPKENKPPTPTPVTVPLPMPMPVRPHPTTFTVQAPQPVYQQVPLQFIQQPPQIQPMPVQPIHEIQPMPVQSIYTISQPNQPVPQPQQYLIRNSLPLAQSQLGNISFQTIPINDTQHSIRVVSPPPQPSNFFQPRKPKPSIVVPEIIIDPEPQKPVQNKSQTISMIEPVVEQTNQKPSSKISFVLPSEDKRNQVATIVNQSEINPNNVNFLAMQAQNFSSLRTSQGQSLSVSQQRSQQVRFSSQTTQSSRSESRQVQQRIEQVNQQSTTIHEDENDEENTVSGDEQIHIISEDGDN